MPLQPEIAAILSEAGPVRILPSPEEYLSKIPTLNPEDFPDGLTMSHLKRCGDANTALQNILVSAGLTRGQLGGLNNIMGTIEKIGDYDITVGDIRELSLEQLFKLQNKFRYGKPSQDSLRKIKKRCC